MAELGPTGRVSTSVGEWLELDNWPNSTGEKLIDMPPSKVPKLSDMETNTAFN